MVANDEHTRLVVGLPETLFNWLPPELSTTVRPVPR